MKTKLKLEKHNAFTLENGEFNATVVYVLYERKMLFFWKEIKVFDTEQEANKFIDENYSNIEYLN